jgi:hypothetical protein
MPETLALATLEMCERHGRDSLDGIIDRAAFAKIADAMRVNNSSAAASGKFTLAPRL